MLTGAAGVLACAGAMAAAQEPQPISLPPAETSGGKPVLEALSNRHTTREFRKSSLDRQTLANLLWAGFGINRPASGGRTAPSAMNSQELDLYAALPEGLFIYDPKVSRLNPVAGGDLRPRITKQSFGTNSAVVLLFVADLDRLAKAGEDRRLSYATFDAGCISQNIYLYCAGTNLGTVVFDLDRSGLTELMKLRPRQRVIFAQAVGYPVEAKRE